MTYKEESYVLDTLKEIQETIRSPEFKQLIKETHENNIMLKSIVKYLSDQHTNADSENFNDFIRNIMANMISTNMEQFMFGRFNNR